ncbi:hypothetical protein GCM10011338_18610 [Alteromonas lipolytica]|nr:hypothetical protein GCM10011338_18610 [Alteromonas lipolytica]
MSFTMALTSLRHYFTLTGSLAQQKIWNLTDPGMANVFMPQDQGPTMMRRMIDRLIKQESSS